MTTNITRLSNGMTVVSDRIEHVETVALGVWVDVGARHETVEVNGVSHMLEHMAFKGTARRSARDIAEEIEAVGGHMNAYTSRENTAYYVKVLKEDVGLGLDIISDILQNAALEPEELERERQVILQEIAQANDTPDDIVFDHFQETAFPNQPVGWPVMGRPDVISGITRDAVSDFMGSLYSPERMVLSAAGKIEHDELVRQAEQAFIKLPAHKERSVEPLRYQGGELKVERKELEQAHVIIGLQSIPYGADDFYDLAVYNTVLGGGMSSRLFQEIRENRGLVYSIYSFNSHYVDGGLFGIYAGTGPDALEELVPAVCQELKRSAEDITEQEASRARAQLKASVLMGLESCSHRCETAARQIQVFGRLIDHNEIIDRIEAVNRDGMMAAAQKMLSGAKPTLTALGPIASVPGVDQISGWLK